MTSRPASNQPVSIMVMGATGSGKSTFINLLSGSNLRVSNRLGSCTQNVEKSDLKIDGRSVILIDTPGFDDTERSDLEILKILASSLEEMYRKHVMLDGVIYLHRITDVRMGGASRRSFNLFLKICGQGFLRNTAIVTTMWDKTSKKEGEDRERALTSGDLFFKAALDGEARIFRHENTLESAINIVRATMSPGNHVPLQIQDELVDQGKTILMTEAATEIYYDMRETFQKFKKDMIDIRSELKEAKRERDERSIAELKGESCNAKMALSWLQQELKSLEKDRRHNRKKKSVFSIFFCLPI